MNQDDNQNDDFYAIFENNNTKAINIHNDNTNNTHEQNNSLSNNQINNESETNDKIERKMKRRRNLFHVFFAFLMLLVISSVSIIVLAELKIIKLPWLEYPKILTLSQNEVNIKKDSNYQFSTYVYPSQVHYGKVVFESSDPTIAEINSLTGYVEAKKNGVVTIKAYLEEYSDIFDTCELVVSNSNVTVESITVKSENINTIVGNKQMLNYEYYPKNAGLHYFTYNSSDTSIISVNNKGEVTALKPGKAVINIIDEVSGKSTHQEFTVYKGNDNQEKQYVVSNIKLSTDEISLSLGGEYQVSATVYPIDIEQEISWSSVNSNIVTVNKDGLIKAVDYGKTEVIATAIDGTNKIINVTVQEEKIPLSNIKINENIVLDIGDSKKVSMTIEPKIATDQAIIFSVSDETIATIDRNGKVTGISAGKTKIKATASDGNLISEATVTVNKPANIVNATNLKISQEKVSINDGSSININVEVVPSNATNKKLTWSSSNNDIASVSNGMIYGNSPGTAYISVKTNNGITKQIVVDVNPIIVDSISLNETNTKIGVGGEIKLYATFNPSNASYKNITFSSNNSSIASVDENGVVTTHKLGSTTITAKSVNGKTATCTITVTNEKIQVTSLSLNSTQYTVKANEKLSITPIINPSNATDQKITYSVNNTNIATVESDGSIKGLKEGVVTLTAKTSNGKTATAFIIVKNKNTSINYLNGNTIKYWYDSSYETYAITHIWVKDAYSQFKVEIPDKFGTLANPYTLTQKAAKKNTGKTLFSVNASGYVNESFSTTLYETNKAWKNTSVSPIVIYEGNVLRDFTTMDLKSNTYRIYAMDKNSNLMSYGYSLNKNDNTGLAQKLLDDGVKYTFGFSPTLVSKSEVIKNLATQNNIRQGICQIDSNNFLYISNITSNRSKGFSPNSLAIKMKELGCQTGLNLDGGGSTSIYYVQKGSNTPTKIKAMEGTYGRAIPDIIYFVGD